MKRPFDIYKIPYRISLEKELYEEKEEEKGYTVKKVGNLRKIEVEKEKIIEKEKVKTIPPVFLSSEQEAIDLESLGLKIVGNIFDRVKFLKQRIEELTEAIEERKLMNKKFNEEIEREIAELERILPSISNKEELREFKLNLMMLRMERRKENTNFWKDLVSLKKQLRELIEEYEIESKISKILGDGNGRIQNFWRT